MKQVFFLERREEPVKLKRVFCLERRPDPPAFYPKHHQKPKQRSKSPARPKEVFCLPWREDVPKEVFSLSRREDMHLEQSPDDEYWPPYDDAFTLPSNELLFGLVSTKQYHL